MPNPIDILSGGPAVMTDGMYYAFKDSLIKIQGVPGVVTLWDLLDYVARNVGEGGGGEEALIQYVADQATDEIEISINGGQLPSSDGKILLIGPTGPLIPGGPNGFTADRVSTPNKLILDSAPFMPINFTIIFFVQQP